MAVKREIIAVFLIAGIGDLVMASKSLRAIRNGFPDSEIHLLTSTEASVLAENYPYVDRVRSFPVRELRNDRFHIFRVPKLIGSLRTVEFDTAINLYRISSWFGALKMGMLFSLLRARCKVGHDHKGFGLFLHKKAPAGIFRKRHLADAMLDIARMAGGVPDDKGVEVFWKKGCEQGWMHLFPREKRKPIIGINPGADRPHKRWNQGRYAVMADRIIEQLGAKVILLGGPGEEGIAKRIQAGMKNKAIDLAGRLTLNVLACVINELDLLVTNDSGPMHIAAALKTPIVAIFGPEDPIYSRPCTSPDLYRIINAQVDCRPCIKDSCARPICLERITPEEVIEKCLEMLAES